MIVGAALITYWVALSAANGAYDRSLLDPALDIADNIRTDGNVARVDLPQKALEALVYDQLDTVIYQVRSERDEIIDGASELPAPPAISPGEHLFFDGTYRGAPIRVAALHATNGFTIQVGETLNKRNRLVREILLAELVPTLPDRRGSRSRWRGLGSRGDCVRSLRCAPSFSDGHPAICGRSTRRGCPARSLPSSTHSMDCSGICATRALCSSAFLPTPRTSFGLRSPVSRCISSC